MRKLGLQGFLSLTVVILLLALVSEARAALLYEQDFVTDPSGVFSNIGGQVGADQFTLQVDATVTAVLWHGFYSGVDLAPSVTSLNFSLTFFPDDNGLPGQSPSYDRVVSGQVQNTGSQVTAPGFQNGRVIYEFSADPIAPFSIRAGETTWISIAEVDPSTPAVGGTQWLWSFSSFSPGDTKAFRNTSPGRETSFQLSTEFGQLAFALTGTVAPSAPIPEPGTLFLIGSGLVGLGAGAWRRKKY